MILFLGMTLIRKYDYIPNNNTTKEMLAINFDGDNLIYMEISKYNEHKRACYIACIFTTKEVIYHTNYIYINHCKIKHTL